MCQRERLETHDRAGEDGVVHRSIPAGQYTWAMPIYEYACMECEDHFDELVRSDEQVVTCPTCGAGNVLKQISAFAVQRRCCEAVLRRRSRRLLRRRLRLQLKPGRDRDACRDGFR